MKESAIGYGGCALEAVLTLTQTNEVFQLIQICLTILSTLVVLGFTFYKWYKKAKEDGKITKDEVDELVDEIKENINDRN